MRKIFYGKILMALTLLVTLFGVSTSISAEEVKTAAEIQASVVPILQSYEVNPDNAQWKVDAETRFVLENTDENRENKRLQEVINLISAEFLEIGLPEADVELDKVFTEVEALTYNDILIELSDVSEISDATSSLEAYKIEITESGIKITAASENAVIHALRTVIHLSLTQNGLAHGTITDFPEIAERRVHVDMGRKFFTKDWMIQHIRELSYLKMNALQMHFSENMGFRIESEVAPEIVSEQHLTKDEVREIIAEANKYGISIIPSFDTPGHTEHILKTYPEYGQIYQNGQRSTVALDVTNPDAVQLMKDILVEFLELFEGSTDFHIGADEYMEFDRAPFTTQVQPLLNTYAEKTLGEGYNWKDVMATYINELAEIVHDHGMKPRIWNDGIYYGETNGGGGAAQKVEMHKYIGIDYWSQMSWNRSIANLQTFINKGHEDIYNINASFFYYVLRPSKPTDGRDQASFDYPNQDVRIFNEWSPGKFQENTIRDDHPSIKGASLAIWNDVPELVTEDVITDGISKELRSLATKSWNTKSNSVSNIEAFRTTYKTVGNAPGFEKGSVLPETEGFKEVRAINLEALELAVEKADAIKLSTLTTESKTQLRTDLRMAKEVLRLKKPTQEQVDEASTTLEATLAGLNILGDNTELKASYKAANKIKFKELTTDSQMLLTEALEAAETSLANKDASQDDLDQALLDLETAVSELKYLADKSELKSVYKTARKVKLDKLSLESKVELVEAMNKVEKVLLDQSSGQELIDTHTNSLKLIVKNIN